jgi:hypothetical protein
MDIQNRLIKPFLLSALLGPALSGALLADDTEVYIGANQVSTVRPNLVFIIDTSGSAIPTGSTGAPAPPRRAAAPTTTSISVSLPVTLPAGHFLVRPAAVSMWGALLVTTTEVRGTAGID